MKKLLLSIISFVFIVQINAQDFYRITPESSHWVDSVFNSLTPQQRIAQLMVVRLSEKKGSDVIFYTDTVNSLIQKYNIGSVCLFQGAAAMQANILNQLQQAAQTPLMICIDGETGLGMRIGDVQKFPDQLTMGAMQNDSLVYAVGKAIGEQCRRMNIQVNYAPVVDINNNPNNPVINFRSFGEDKVHVALFGTQIMRGMQSENVMACAKHFPGHGDVAVDSHLDLPVISKSLAQLDSLELYPFKTLFETGVGSVMIAHLSIPAIDASPNRPTSLSKNNVTGLLRDSLGFKGISFTDALEMKGVAKYFPQGEAVVQSLIAGNDMLCLPGNVPEAIDKVLFAIKKKKLDEDDIDARVKKVLLAKYNLGLNVKLYTDTLNLTTDLNKDVAPMRKAVAENAITLLKHDDYFSLPLLKENKTAYIAVGVSSANTICNLMRDSSGADIFTFPFNSDVSLSEDIQALLSSGNYDNIIVGLHNCTKYPANNFGISKAAIDFINQLDEKYHATTLVFANPYTIKNFCNSKNIIACYEDDSIFRDAAWRWLCGGFVAKGKLPVTVCNNFHYGDGITNFIPEKKNLLTEATPESQYLNSKILNRIDSIADVAISNQATPGCVVLVARNNKIVFYKAYGHLTYSNDEPVKKNTVYDIASCTKTSATTLAIMKLYEDGKIDLNKTLGDYLPWTKGSNKQNIRLRDLLLHQAGLDPFIPFYKETIDTFTGVPKEGFYTTTKDSLHTIPVAANMFMRSDWVDTMYKRILQSPLSAYGKYVYSDNDFIFLQKVVEAVSGMSLDKFAEEYFYCPLEMTSTKFNPLDSISLSRIAPTEHEINFRRQVLRGYVHDPGAAMFGGVSGHAGLFSDAYDLAKLYCMLLNGGEWDGTKYFNKGTIAYFTAYQTNNSRRGLGFDKPEKNNYSRREPYPAIQSSPETFGHTGFTGTCIWADPKYNLLFIFLSNRVYPYGGANGKLSSLNIRVKMLETVYESIIPEDKPDER